MCPAGFSLEAPLGAGRAYPFEVSSGLQNEVAAGRVGHGPVGSGRPSARRPALPFPGDHIAHESLKRYPAKRG